MRTLRQLVALSLAIPFAFIAGVLFLLALPALVAGLLAVAVARGVLE